MPAEVDLYNKAYANHAAKVYRQVRLETYGHDFGQTSWVTTDESHRIPRVLGLAAGSYALEIGCGSGQYALHVAEMHGCRVLGVDVNEAGVRGANHLAEIQGRCAQARFELCDASKPLPFAAAEFDAAFSNDAFCHIAGRCAVLRELFRVLKPGSKLLYSDALVIAGAVTNRELAIRSAIGFYVFCAPGENERAIEQTGFRLLDAADTTGSAAEIARKWRDAREKRKDQLIAIESEPNFQGVQEFLSCVHALTSERRMLRYVYLAQKLETNLPNSL